MDNTSNHCCNKLPLTGYFDIIEIYSSIIMEYRSPKSVSLGQNQGIIRATLPPEALGEIYFLPLAVSGGFQLFLTCGHIIPVSASVISSFLLLVRTPIAFLLWSNLWLPLEPTWIIQDSFLTSRSLTLCAETPFFIHGKITGSRN